MRQLYGIEHIFAYGGAWVGSWTTGINSSSQSWEKLPRTAFPEQWPLQNQWSKWEWASHSGAVYIPALCVISPLRPLVSTIFSVWHNIPLRHMFWLSKIILLHIYAHKYGVQGRWLTSHGIICFIFIRAESKPWHWIISRKPPDIVLEGLKDQQRCSR